VSRHNLSFSVLLGSARPSLIPRFPLLRYPATSFRTIIRFIDSSNPHPLFPSLHNPNNHHRANTVLVYRNNTGDDCFVCRSCIELSILHNQTDSQWRLIPVTNDLVRIAFKIAFPFRKSGRCKGRCPMNNAPPATLKPKVERFLPVISTLKQFQWQYAWHLFMHQTSIFLMMPCGSGKTYIYIALSIILWFASLNAKKSNRVIIVYAPLNEIIRGQIELVRSMHGTSEGTRYCWHAWNYADNLTLTLQPT
jgi:hypothetical protein